MIVYCKHRIHCTIWLCLLSLNISYGVLMYLYFKCGNDFHLKYTLENHLFTFLFMFLLHYNAVILE